ncbi:MAG TPA: ABC transporter permease [Bryobacteraceae bacterium]|nr:ABC transporter permease [Bryobacteraceae bacterium]
MRDWNAWVRGRLRELQIQPARESEIVAELAQHFEQVYKDARANRLSHAEAMRLVEAACGNWRDLAGGIEQAEHAMPQGRSGPLTGVFEDARHMLRFLLRNPAFAALAIATLGFGVGGNTAIFTLADALSLRGLPYPHAGQLMAIDTRVARQAEIEPATSIPDFLDLRAGASSFSSMAALSPVWNDVRTGAGDAERLDTLYVSAAFFPLLGVQPVLGRTFSSAEDDPGRPRAVAVLSNAYWRGHFGGSPGVLGRSLVLDSRVFTIIGVLPADFHYPGAPLAGQATQIDVWMPLAENQLIGLPRMVRFLKVVGRRKAGVPAKRAADEIRAIGSALAEKYPDANRGLVLNAVPLENEITGRFRGTTTLLLGIAGLILLMACANTAGLLLTRAAAREKDFAMRLALGAPAWRLLRQMMAEALVLATAGGVAGIALACAAVRLIAAAAPASLLPAYAIAVDWRTAAFAFAAILLSAALSGFPPAWSVLREGIGNRLRLGSRTLAGGNRRFRSALVVVEVAAAVVLLTGSGLLIRSFQRLLAVNPGFDPANVVTISTQTPVSARTAVERKAIYHLIRERLLSVPGVLSVGAASRLPLMGSALGTAVTFEGKSRPVDGGAPEVEYRVVTPDYFSTMRIPLRRGRLFTDRDDAQASPVALINESMARKFWPGADPVGKRIKLGPNPETQPWITIAGIVGDVHHFGLDVEARPEVYRPYADSPLFAPILVIRTASDPEPLVNALAAKVRSVDAAIPAYDLFLMQSLVERSTAERRFVMSLLTGFALAALLLAAVGIYGVVSQSVAQRTQEIGIRMALGSPPSAALALVFREGMRLAAMGIAFGLATAAGITRLMENLLFGVQPVDAPAFAAAVAALAGCAALACYAPARRASRVDPLTALRQDG